MAQDKIALCYVRKSYTDDPEDEHSPERQRRTLNFWCEREGYVPEYYTDVDGHRSGRREAGRPGWQKLKEQISRPDVEATIVETVSRSHRNLREFMEFVHEAEKHDVTYISVRESLNSSTIFGKLALQILGAFAEAWANITSEKMKATVEMLREDGKYWGLPPFGTVRTDEGLLAPDGSGVWYRVDDDGLQWREELPSKQEDWLWRGYHDALCELFRLYGTKRYGYASLADELNKEGWRYKSRNDQHRDWRRDDVRRCITLWRLYAGMLTTGSVKDAVGVEVLRDDAWPPIVPLDILIPAVRVYEERGKRYPSPKQRHTFELTPRLYCAHCGKKLTSQTTRYETRKYRHRRKGDCPATSGCVDADDAEAAVHALLSRYSLDDELWSVIEEAAFELPDPDDDANAELQARIALLRRRQKRLQKLYVAEEISWEEYEHQKSAYDAEIEEIEAELEFQNTSRTLFVNTLTRFRQLGALIRQSKPEERRELVAKLFDELHMDPDSVTITDYAMKPWARRLLR